MKKINHIACFIPIFCIKFLASPFCSCPIWLIRLDVLMQSSHLVITNATAVMITRICVINGDFYLLMSYLTFFHQHSSGNFRFGYEVSDVHALNTDLRCM